jgi:hypothetical protein
MYARLLVIPEDIFFGAISLRIFMFSLSIILIMNELTIYSQ